MTLLRLCDQQSATVPPDSTAAEAIRLMLARRVGAVVVVDANRVVGIFTERDVLKKLALSGRDPEKVPVSEMMTTPVETASPQTSPGDALMSMLEHHFRHLPVVDSSGRLRGVLDPQSPAWADGGTQAAASFSRTLCRQRGAGRAQG